MACRSTRDNDRVCRINVMIGKPGSLLAAESLRRPASCRHREKDDIAAATPIASAPAAVRPVVVSKSRLHLRASSGEKVMELPSYLKVTGVKWSPNGKVVIS